MANNTRKTERVTHSTSVTSPAVEPMADPADIPADLVEQGGIDLTNAAIWDSDRLSYRDSLETILTKYENSGRMPVRHLISLYRLVGHNDGKRQRVLRKAPIIPPSEASGPLTVGGGNESRSVPIPDVLEVHASFPFDPPLTALHIALGWGFKSSGVVSRLRNDHPDFPAPLMCDRSAPIWSYSSIWAWTQHHQDDLRAALRHSRAREGAGNSAEALKVQIAALQQKLAQKERS